MQHVGVEAYGGFQLHARLQKPPSPETDTTLRPGLTSHAPIAHGSAAHGLLTVGDHHLTRAEAVEVAGDPDVEAAHIDGKRHVVVHDVLHGAHDAQRMQGKLVKRCAAAVEEVPLMLAIDQNFRGALAQFKLVLNAAGEQVQRGGDIPTSSRSGTYLRSS